MTKMFAQKILGTTALVMAFALPTFAQDAVPADAAAVHSPYLQGVEMGVRASDFIGKRVYVTEADLTGMSANAVAQADTDWQDAGEISDLIISMSGDSEAVLVDFGGFLGIGEKTVAVSMANLTMVPDSGSPDDYFIVFQGNKAALEGAPAYDKDMVFSADNVAPAEPADMGSGDMTATGTAATPMAEGAMVDYATMSDSDLIGKRVYGTNGEDVGEISAVAFDGDNRITAAVVDVGGFIGIGEKPVALSSDMLRLVKDPDSDEMKFQVNATQEQLEALPTYGN